jgi:hypothetical protein
MNVPPLRNVYLMVQPGHPEGYGHVSGENWL